MLFYRAYIELRIDIGILAKLALPEKTQKQTKQIKEPLLKRIGEAASHVPGKPNGRHNIHYGIVMFDPVAYIEQLIDQCARSTFVFVFDFDEHKIAGESWFNRLK